MTKNRRWVKCDLTLHSLTANGCFRAEATNIILLHGYVLLMYVLHTYNECHRKYLLFKPHYLQASGLQINVRNWKLFFLFLNQNICCGYSNEPSQWDGSFEHPKQMFRLLGKKIIAFLRSTILLSRTYDWHHKLVLTADVSGSADAQSDLHYYKTIP